jgi:hypothetical protein
MASVFFSDGAGVRKPPSATRATRAGEFRGALAGEQDIKAGEKLGRLGFG